jgi:hypothetical protein
MKKAQILVADIGSTITKLCAFGGLGSKTPQFLGQGISLTTVGEGDVTIGLENARKDLEIRSGIDSSDAKLMAASSAAGGLRMAVHGLTRDMTLRAAREASLGAGAIVTFTTAGLLQEDDLEEMCRINPNIILLAGGVDYGDRNVVVQNAKALSSQNLSAPIIYAGNMSARAEVKRILETAGMQVFVVENVYPRIDELNVNPVRKIIQHVFSRHIITAPGMKKVKEMIIGDVIPTPGAVMKSTELLYATIGDVVTIDVGGATTDVHSVTEGTPKFVNMMVAPEPKSKRTVEGDLGVYVNAAHIVEAAEGAIDPIDKLLPIPETPEEKRMPITLAQWAVDISLWRHAGEIRVAYGAYGRNELVEGRDLTAVKFIIGTGGALTRLGTGKEILENLRRDPRERKLLPPPDIKVLVDNNYIMATAGVLSQQYKEEARKLLLQSVGETGC